MLIFTRLFEFETWVISAVNSIFLFNQNLTTETTILIENLKWKLPLYKYKNNSQNEIWFIQKK